MRSASAALLACTLLIGCGGSDSGSAAPAGAGPDLGTSIELASCTDWKEGTVEERLGTIRQLGEFIGGQVPGTSGGSGIVLDEDDAYELLDKRCEQGFAQGFSLYKMYSQAAAFSGK